MADPRKMTWRRGRTYTGGHYDVIVLTERPTPDEMRFILPLLEEGGKMLDGSGREVDEDYATEPTPAQGSSYRTKPADTPLPPARPESGVDAQIRPPLETGIAESMASQAAAEESDADDEETDDTDAEKTDDVA